MLVTEYWTIEAQGRACSFPVKYDPKGQNLYFIAEYLRNSLMAGSYRSWSGGVSNAVFTTSGGSCFCMVNGYLFDLDFDPSEFFPMPRWPFNEFRKEAS